MEIQILIAIGVLVAGAVISRLIHSVPLKKLESATRAQLFQNTRRMRTGALIPALIATILFIVGIIAIPEAFLQLVRLMVLAGAGYVALLNILIIIHYIRAECGIVFIIVALISRAIVFASLIVFCYLVITAL